MQTGCTNLDIRMVAMKKDCGVRHEGCGPQLLRFFRQGKRHHTDIAEVLQAEKTRITGRSEDLLLSGIITTRSI